MGFFDDLAKDAALWIAVQMSKDKNGKPDPYKAAGIAAGTGNFSFEDQIRLGTILGSQGAFDDDTFPAGNANYEDIDDPLSDEMEFEDIYDPLSDEMEFEDIYDPLSDEIEFEDIDDLFSDEMDFGKTYDPLLDAEILEKMDDFLSNETDLEEVDLEETDFGETDLEGVDLEEADLDEADFEENGLDETDYPNKRTYRAKLELESDSWIYPDEEAEKRSKERCHFVLDHPEILASAYFAMDSGFLYAQAVKEHFDLPVSLPDEDEKVKTDFFHLIQKIAAKDMKLAVRVWDWCIDQFMPYAEYEYENGRETLTTRVIDRLSQMPKGFLSEIIRYMNKNPEFCHKIVRDAPSLSYGIGKLICQAVKEKTPDVAKLIFGDAVEVMDSEEKLCNQVQNVFRECGVRKNSYTTNIVYENKKTRNDKKIYCYCGVIFENGFQLYHYRTNDKNLKIGDKVIVPAGANNREVLAEIVSVEQHTRMTAPYPPEKCKFVIRKYSE